MAQLFSLGHCERVEFLLGRLVLANGLGDSGFDAVGFGEFERFTAAPVRERGPGADACGDWSGLILWSQICRRRFYGLTRALQRTAAPLSSRTVRVIWPRLLQPTGRFRRRSLSLVGDYARNYTIIPD